MPSVPEYASQKQEADNILSLLIYSLVYKNWQPNSLSQSLSRGYNIGALLVNKQFEPVFFGLNCINATGNATQHGEVRAITRYIEKEKCFNLEGFTIYTTLEPCIMCAGMMTMTSVYRVVYGQHDVGYSKAFERLSTDTRPIGGFPPYPRMVLNQAATVEFTGTLDRACKLYLETNDEKILAKFLHSEPARNIYKDAYNCFMQFEVQHHENISLYEKAIQFLKISIHES